MSGVVTDGVGTQALQEYAEQMITILLPVQELSWREMVWVKDKFGHIDDAVVNKVCNWHAELDPHYKDYLRSCC